MNLALLICRGRVKLAACFGEHVSQGLVWTFHADQFLRVGERGINVDFNAVGLLDFLAEP